MKIYRVHNITRWETAMEFHEADSQNNPTEWDIVNWFPYFLSHDQDTVHAEKVCAEICDFCMAALMFLTDHGTKARTHAHVEITYSPTLSIIRMWKALCLWPCASQVLWMLLIGKCTISAWTWVLAIMRCCYTHLICQYLEWILQLSVTQSV